MNERDFARHPHAVAAALKAPAPLALTFWSDPGHGWLECPMALLRDLDPSLSLLHKVSSYSYRSSDGLLAYLEEDCDAALLVEALKAAGQPFKFVERYQENIFIRHLPHFPRRTA